MKYSFLSAEQRREFAENPNTSQQTLDLLSRDSGYVVRYWVAVNKKHL